VFSILAGVISIGFGLFCLWPAPRDAERGSILIPILHGLVFLLIGVYALWTGWFEAIAYVRAMFHGT
jgi:hypothetical protein